MLNLTAVELDKLRMYLVRCGDVEGDDYSLWKMLLDEFKIREELEADKAFVDCLFGTKKSERQ